MSENKVGYLFAAPGILGFLIFTAGPMLISLYYSFTEFSVLAKLKWNGLQNYITMLTSPSSLFLKSLSVTLIYAGLNAVLTMVFSIAVALLLNRSFRGRGILMGIIFSSLGNTDRSEYGSLELDSGLSKWFDKPTASDDASGIAELADG